MIFYDTRNKKYLFEQNKLQLITLIYNHLFGIKNACGE